MPRIVASISILTCFLSSGAGCVIAPTIDANIDATDGASGGVDESAGTGPEGADSTGEDGCVQLEQLDIQGDTVLMAGCYDVAELLFVEDRLELEPGVEISFTAPAGLSVQQGGVLSAVGLEDNPILLTSATDEGWAGIEFQGAASSDNRLEHVTLELLANDGVRVASDSRLTVEHTEIRGAPDHGLWVEFDAEVTVSASVFVDNGVPIHVPLGGVEGVGIDNALADNVSPVVSVAHGRLDDDAHWSNVGVPLRVSGDITVDGALSIGPGVEIEMPQEARITVDETGSLSALGTSDAPIVFRGREPESGYWLGIGFVSKSASNVLSRCIVEHGGSGRWTASPNTEGMIWLDRGAKLEMSDTLLRHSDGATVLANEDDIDLSGFSNNTLTGGALPMWLAADVAQQLGPGNSFSGNTNDHVLIGVNLGPKIEFPGTWRALDVPYRIAYRFDVEAAWTIEPGVNVEFMQDVYITVEDGGSISAVGTPELPIVFRGVEALPGYWRGLEILTLSANNVMDHVELRHGGSDGHSGNSDSDATIFVQQASLTLRNSIVAESGGWGLAVFNGGQLQDCSGVGFADNAKGAQFIHGSGASAC